MRTIETTFQTFGASVLLLGYKGDSQATQILIDCAEALEDYQGTMAALSITAPDETVYPGDITLDEDGVVHWVLSARDCGIAGHGSARIDLVNDEETVVASAEATTMIIKTNMQGVAPDQIREWTEAASVALQEVKNALLDLYQGDNSAMANEAARQLAETGRVNAELLRVAAENGRVTAEGLRVQAENARVTAEGLRDQAETARETAEGLRDQAEGARETAEEEREEGYSTIEQNAQAALSYIGPSEASSTASAAHAQGSYLIYDGKLYQATADIAVGDTLAATGDGANIAQVTGGAMGEVADLKSALTSIEPDARTVNSSKITDTSPSVGVAQKYVGSDNILHVYNDYSVSSAIPMKCGDYVVTTLTANNLMAAIAKCNTLFTSFTAVVLGAEAAVSEHTYTYTADEDCNICLSYKTASGANYKIYRSVTIEDIKTKIANGSLISDGSITKQKTDFWQRQKSANLLNPSDWISGYYYVSSGAKTANANFSYVFIELDGAGTYVTSGDYAALGNNCLYMPLYSAKDDTTWLSSVTATAIDTSVATDYKLQFTITDAQISSGVKYLILSKKTANTANVMCVKASTYPSTYIPYYDKYVIPTLSFTSEQMADIKDSGILANILFGKTAMFDGDSICAGTGTETPTVGRGWAGRIGDGNKMAYVNYGVGGGTITSETYNGSTPRHWVSDNIDTIYSQHNETDYYIFEGGTNDADLLGDSRTSVKFGTLDVNDYVGPFDKTTFTGAMDYICQKALSYWPRSKIGYIVAHKMGYGSTGYDVTTNNRYRYFVRAMEVCKKWAIPVINLWDDAQLNPNLASYYYGSPQTQEQAYADGYCYIDGQHLTKHGYDLISPKIAQWMRGL